MRSDQRLIEDVLPIAAISGAAQREQTCQAATHPRELHLWWARGSLAAARAAVYAALVPAQPRDRTPEEEAAFFSALCRWDAGESTVRRAREDVLLANDGRPPKVLDLFAGAGSIPLEAARLGCDATAVELNPVAHLIGRVILEYPQQHPGLGGDFRRWGRAWVDRAWNQLADLYPSAGTGQDDGLRPLAYLWTRAVRCPNPALPEHRADLVRQTWLARERDRAIALRPVVHPATLTVRYEVVEAPSADALGFDPADGSRRGQAACRICGATIPYSYLRCEGQAGRLIIAPLCAVLLKQGGRGRDYISVGRYDLPDDADCLRRIAALPVDPPAELLPADDTRRFSTPRFGLTRFQDLFTPRQLLTLCTLTAGLRPVYEQMRAAGVPEDRATAVATCLAFSLDRALIRNNSLCGWDAGTESARSQVRQALPMVWDFAEMNPFGGDILEDVANSAEILAALEPVRGAAVIRGSATTVPLDDGSLDAVITDPPYHDNISYAELSDFFYVWLKRGVGFLYPDVLGGQLTSKHGEAVVAPHRHHGDKDEARACYEQMIAAAFTEAHRVLKRDARLVCIYGHQTVPGWASLVHALRIAGFTVTAAWPLHTGMTRAPRTAAAAPVSSVFLVSRKRDAGAGTGSEADVMGELDVIITDRVARLTGRGIAGPDLVIATVGAGLRAFTRYESVEQDNGEALSAERFLLVAQSKVLDAIPGSLTNAGPVS